MEKNAKDFLKRISNLVETIVKEKSSIVSASKKANEWRAYLSQSKPHWEDITWRIKFPDTNDGKTRFQLGFYSAEPNEKFNDAILVSKKIFEGKNDDVIQNENGLRLIWNIDLNDLSSLNVLQDTIENNLKEFIVCLFESGICHLNLQDGIAGKKSETEPNLTENDLSKKMEELRLKEEMLEQKERELKAKELENLEAENKRKINEILSVKNQIESNQFSASIDQQKQINQSSHSSTRDKQILDSSTKKSEYGGIQLIPMKSVEHNNLWGYVDPEMNWVIHPTYSCADEFFDSGVAIVGRNALINCKGEVLLSGFENLHSADDRYYIVKERKEDFYRICANLRNYNSYHYQGLNPVKINDNEFRFIDIQLGKFTEKTYEEIEFWNFGFFIVKNDEKKSLLSRNGELLIDHRKSINYLGDNCFEIYSLNGKRDFYKYANQNLQVFDLGFTLKEKESVTRISRGFIEVEYQTYFYEVEDKTMVKFYKSGKLLAEFEKHTKEFCIDLSGEYKIYPWGNGTALGERMFWFDINFKKIKSLKGFEEIYWQNGTQDYKENYSTQTMCLVTIEDKSKLLFLDYLNGRYKCLKLHKEYESIYKEKGYFGLKSGYGDYFDYLIDQNGNIVFEDLKKSNFFSQVKPSNHSSYFFVVQNGKEYLVDANGYCPSEKMTISQIYQKNRASISLDTIQEFIRQAKKGKKIEESTLNDIRQISELGYLQLCYLNAKIDNENVKNTGQQLLKFLGYKIHRITFAVKFKRSFKSDWTNKSYGKGALIKFNAYYYSESKVELNKSEALSYLEFNWLLDDTWVKTKDTALEWFKDGGTERFWRNVGSLNHKDGGANITKPEIIEIKLR
jgi:hypothetical protein